jgi:hypothetical protein
MLAFAVLSTLTFANEKINEPVMKDGLQLSDFCTSVETINYELYGECTALVFNFDDEGNLIGIYDVTWESSLSDIEGGCALDAQILQFALNIGY